MKGTMVKAGTPCIFPFEWQGKVYQSCTHDNNHLTGNNPWCVTKLRNTVDRTTKKGIFKKGVYGTWDRRKSKSGDNLGKRNWGICDESAKSKCTIPPKREFSPKRHKKP